MMWNLDADNDNIKLKNGKCFVYMIDFFTFIFNLINIFNMMHMCFKIEIVLKLFNFCRITGRCCKPDKS